MTIRNILFILVLLGGIVLFWAPCTAGIWKDDFSDSTLRGWGGSITNDDEFLVRVKDGYFNFKGLQENANFTMTNWALGEIKNYSLEMKWKVRRIDLKEGRWGILYQAYDEEHKLLKGMLKFLFDYRLMNIIGSNVIIYRKLPKPQLLLARTHFAHKERVWYTFQMKAVGNRYTFSVDNEVLAEIEDNSVPTGQVGFTFHGMIDVCLDDFTVTGPNVPNGGPGWRAVTPPGKLTMTWGKLKSQD